MQSVIKHKKKILLQNPILIEGLPGIGYVAYLSASYLINKLQAVKFAEIISPYFQNFTTSSMDGLPRSPAIELYFWSSGKYGRDLIILWGNTQPLTVYGQYELCGRVLDFVQDLGCNFVVSLGGLKQKKVVDSPKLYTTFTDLEILREMQAYSLKLVKGRIYGMAGLLIGLAALRKMRGFCLLAETFGVYPDKIAAREILKFLMRYLRLKIDLKKLDEVTKETIKNLEFLGINESKRMGKVLGFF